MLPWKERETAPSRAEESPSPPPQALPFHFWPWAACFCLEFLRHCSPWAYSRSQATMACTPFGGKESWPLQPFRAQFQEPSPSSWAFRLPLKTSLICEVITFLRSSSSGKCLTFGFWPSSTPEIMTEAAFLPCPSPKERRSPELKSPFGASPILESAFFRPCFFRRVFPVFSDLLPSAPGFSLNYIDLSSFQSRKPGSDSF